MDLTAQPVTPQELDEWLRFTDVDDHDDDNNNDEKANADQFGEEPMETMRPPPLISAVSAPVHSQHAKSAQSAGYRRSSLMDLSIDEHEHTAFLNDRPSSASIDRRVSSTFTISNAVSHHGIGNAVSREHEQLYEEKTTQPPPLISSVSAPVHSQEAKSASANHRRSSLMDFSIDEHEHAALLNDRPSSVNVDIDRRGSSNSYTNTTIGHAISSHHHHHGDDAISPLVSDDGSAPSCSPYDDLSSRRKVDREFVLNKVNKPPLALNNSRRDSTVSVNGPPLARLNRRDSNSNMSCHSGKTCASSDTVPVRNNNNNDNNGYSRSVSEDQAGNGLTTQNKTSTSRGEASWPLVMNGVRNKTVFNDNQEQQDTYSPMMQQMSRSVSLPGNDHSSSQHGHRKNLPFSFDQGSSSDKNNFCRSDSSGQIRTSTSPSQDNILSAMNNSQQSQEHSVHSRRSMGLMRKSNKTREILFRALAMGDNNNNKGSSADRQRRGSFVSPRLRGHQHNMGTMSGSGDRGHRRGSVSNAVTRTTPTTSTSASTSSTSPSPFPSYSRRFSDRRTSTAGMGMGSSHSHSHRPTVGASGVGGWKRQDRMNVMLQNIMNAEEDHFMMTKRGEQHRQHQQQQQQQQQNQQSSILSSGISETSAMMWRPAPKHYENKQSSQYPFQKHQQPKQQQQYEQPHEKRQSCQDRFRYPAAETNETTNDNQQRNAVQVELQRIAMEQMMEMEGVDRFID